MFAYKSLTFIPLFSYISYKIGVCLEYPPHTIAAGSIYLASKLLEEPLKEHIYGEPWMKVLKVRSVDLEGTICSATLECLLIDGWGY